MTKNFAQLPVFSRDTDYYAPDFSEIRLGPQIDIMPGNIASATFAAGKASQTVVHSTNAPIPISEKWFYPKDDNLPNVYILLNDDIYQITPGTKLEMPLGTKFQLYNPSDKPAPFLMITYPYWPQDERAAKLTDAVEGPWQSENKDHGQPHSALTPEKIRAISYDDPFFREGMSGDEYVRTCLESVGQNIDDYNIAGKTWTNYEKEFEGLTPQECEIKALHIDPVAITADMDGKRIYPLSPEEKERIINLNPSLKQKDDTLKRKSTSPSSSIASNSGNPLKQSRVDTIFHIND